MFEALGHYKLLDRIGSGGIGEVYRARDTRLGRTVAVKVVGPAIADDPDRRQRFIDDARAAAVLSHPSIAAVYEVGEDQGQLFVALEFVPGEPLRAAIGGRPMNPKRAIDLAVQIADALADAHAEGIAHRDINTDNVVETPKGRAKILDLGLSAWTAGGEARARAASQPMPIDAAAYLSPEQALGDAGDYRSDIFSLGAVLFEMLTGRTPFRAADSAAMLLQIVQAPAPVPSAMNPAVPREADAIVARMLAKSLDQRYESAATVAAELRSVSAILDERAATAETRVAAALPVRGRSGGAARRAIAIAVIVIAVALVAWFGRDTFLRDWLSFLR